MGSPDNVSDTPAVLTVPGDELEPRAGTPTARLHLPVPADLDPADVPADIGRLSTALDTAALTGQGTLASRPAPGTPGNLYTVVGDPAPANNGIVWWDTGTAWLAVGAAARLAGTLASRPAPGAAGRTYYSTDTGHLDYDDGAAWHTVGGLRTWYAHGDGSGTGQVAPGGAFSSAGSPAIAYPPANAVPGQWYRVRAHFGVAGSMQPVAATTLGVTYMLSTDGLNGLGATYAVVTIAGNYQGNVSFARVSPENTWQQGAAGAPVAGAIRIYFASAVAGMYAYLQNDSTATAPQITLEEINPPS